MVVINFIKNKYFLAVILSFIVLYTSCEVDFAGLFRSEELDTRLEAAYSFPYLDGNNWRELNIESSYSFIFVTDTHILGDDTNSLENLQNKFIASDSFVVFGGDITQSGTRKELTHFIEITTAWKKINGEAMPCYPTIGNHDIYFGNWELWKNLIGSTRYRVDSTAAGGTTILVLDTANAYFGNGQLDWLQRQLKSAKQNTFIFAHGTLFVSANILETKKSIPVHERARIISIISDSPAKAYFSGHIHERTEESVRGKKYFSLEDFQSHRTFMRVTVNGAGAGVSYSFHSL